MAVERLLAKLAEEKKILEEKRKSSNLKGRVQSKIIPKGIPIRSRMHLSNLSDGGKYFLKTTDFTIQFDVEKQSSLILNGVVIRRNMSKALLAKICFSDNCGYNSQYDSTKVIAQPGASPGPGERFRVELRGGTYSLRGMKGVHFLSGF